MHIVIVHGYLLQGTGSNIYVANIARAFKNIGHSVTVICQDRKAKSLSFVDEFFDILDTVPAQPPEKGTIRVIVPPIDNLLPVFVMDEYEGYEVKTVANFTEEEIESHIRLTGYALKKILSGGVDLIIANHAILSPLIVKRALEGFDVPYKVKIHGSAIEFQLAPYPVLMKYATEGLSRAEEVIAGSEHIRKRLLNVFADFESELNLKEKIRIVSPGMDPQLFKLIDSFEKNNAEFFSLLNERILADSSGRRRMKINYPIEFDDEDFHKWLVDKCNEYNQRVTDTDLPERFEPVNAENCNIIYFGKFLETKGVGELLLLIPSLIKKNPRFRFFFVGFGTYREHLEGLLEAMKTGNLKLALKCASAGDFVTDINVKDVFTKLDTASAARITVTGILDHEQLAALLPMMDICVVPSKLAEAFGMVAAEALSAGVMPIVNYHSGLKGISDNLIEDFPEMKNFIPADKDSFFQTLSDNILKCAEFLFPGGTESRDFRAEAGKKLRKHAIKHYSWDKIAKELLGV